MKVWSVVSDHVDVSSMPVAVNKTFKGALQDIRDYIADTYNFKKEVDLDSKFIEDDEVYLINVTLDNKEIFLGEYFLIKEFEIKD